MQLRYSRHFLRSYAAAPEVVRQAVDKQLVFLERDLLAHPSLHAKKYDEAQDLWQARVNRDWRLYFSVQGGECYLHEVRRHPK